VHLRDRIDRWLSAAWGQALFHGLLFGVSMTILGGYDGRPFTAAAPKTAVIAAGFAAYMWLLVYRRQGREVSRILGALPQHQRRAARLAAVRGDLPADPRARSAVTELVRYRLDRSLAHRTPVAVLFAAFTLSCVGAAFADSPWWAAAAAVFAGVIVSMWVTPRRLSRRLELIGGLRV
jgi:hypothetical protein